MTKEGVYKMIGSTQNNSIFNIGNVGLYAQNAVKNALAENKNSITGALSGINSLLGGGSWQDTISSTTKSTMSFASENAKNLNGLKQAAYSLSRSASNFGASTLTSTDSQVLTATGTSYSNSTASYDVAVTQMATQQQQQSAAFKTGAASEFSAGTHSMEIQTENGSHTIEFEIGASDTNADALKKMASSINASKAGVTASVVHEGGNSSLRITSTATGESSQFEITGDATATLSMGVTQAAQDAKYSINGQQFTSASNTVGMPDGRAGTMTFKSTGTATVSRSVDASKVVAAAQEFAKAYNKSVEHLASNTNGGAGSMRALSMIDGVGRVDSRTGARLASMGITIDENGMQVDTEKLTKAVQENPSSVKNTLGGYGGVAEKVERGADQALRIPTATYTDFSKMQVHNSLIDSLLPKGSGILFDLYR